MLALDPAQRLSAEQCLSHAFFRNAPPPMSAREFQAATAHFASSHEFVVKGKAGKRSRPDGEPGGAQSPSLDIKVRQFKAVLCPWCVMSIQSSSTCQSVHAYIARRLQAADIVTRLCRATEYARPALLATAAAPRAWRSDTPAASHASSVHATTIRSCQAADGRARCIKAQVWSSTRAAIPAAARGSALWLHSCGQLRQHASALSAMTRGDAAMSP
jgi:hypothetical protein